ncbi:MAG TPA: membrane-bound lytic murein transglycosylase MltF, partial [Rhodocyclaceae bacterium]|nr:membrane-bound lytic murein transglycosylase MltF [Rhodocyclaceae bacterium]
LIPFEHDLLLRLAERLDKPLEIILLRSANEVIEHVAAGRAHLGAAWLSPGNDSRVTATTAFHADALMLIQQDPSVVIDHPDELSGKTVHVPIGSIAAGALDSLRKQRIPSLTVIERPDGSGVGLLRAVADHEIELSAAPGELASIAQNYFPEMLISAALTEKRDIVWLTANQPGNDVMKPVNEFLNGIKADGTLARVKDAHFSFRRRLNQDDTTQFIERINAVLPDYYGLFKQAQIRTNIDWRLLASLAYQESQWDPNATSPTGVRGMMMLTEETADRLRVSNRLDAKESILAGADYLAMLRDELPDAIKEPDRTWMALAAYNLGMGHLRGGRALAPSFKLNPDTWFDMKKMLPKLTRPEVYDRLKSGRARGGEAVILVENVRAFYDILSRHAPAHTALAESAESPRIFGLTAELRLRDARPQAAPTSAASRM